MLYHNNLPCIYCCSLVLCSPIHVPLGLKSTTFLKKNAVGKAFHKSYDSLRSVLGMYVHGGGFFLISLLVCFDASLNASSLLTATVCLLPAEAWVWSVKRPVCSRLGFGHSWHKSEKCQVFLSFEFCFLWI